MNYENTAVIVVDMQNSFAHEDGSLYAPPSEKVIGEIQEFVNEMRENGSPIIFTKDTHTQEQFEELDNYDEFDRWGEHAIEGTFEHEIVEGLDVEDDDDVVEKGTYDAFHNTRLNGILVNRGVENVIVIGTLANVCVMHTASSAALNDYRTVVLEDLVGYIEESDKEYALEHIDWLFGEVMDSSELVQEME